MPSYPIPNLAAIPAAYSQQQMSEPPLAIRNLYQAAELQNLPIRHQMLQNQASLGGLEVQKQQQDFNDRATLAQALSAAKNPQEAFKIAYDHAIATRNAPMARMLEENRHNIEMEAETGRLRATEETKSELAKRELALKEAEANKETTADLKVKTIKDKYKGDVAAYEKDIQKPLQETDADRYVNHMAAAHKQASGQDATEAQKASWMKDYKNSQTQLRIDNPSTSAADREATRRLDNSYNTSTKRIEALVKPIRDRQERLGRLIQSVEQNDATADALIAPELVAAAAGGLGSGLRITQPEINNVQGGRTVWETIRANANKWSLTPQAAQIPDTQRAAIRQLATVLKAKIDKKMSAAQGAQDSLDEAKSVEEHRHIVSDFGKQINAIETPAATATQAGPKVGEKKTFPNGKVGVWDGQGWAAQ